jgi:hypothetical protein
VRHGLLWLAAIELRRTALRSSIVVLAIAVAVLATTLFVQQIGFGQAEVMVSYEQAGATTVLAELTGVPEEGLKEVVEAIRQTADVRSVEVPYSGVRLGLVADVSFLVFQNEQQKEYLGARTTVLGVDRDFDARRDYYVDYRDLSEEAPAGSFGIPLFAASGSMRQPTRREVAVASDVTDYVGVRPGAMATVDLIYAGASPPIVRRLEGLRLIETFDAAGPDQGRFDPYWQLAVQGEEVLTVRRPDAKEGVTTTLPILLNDEVVREFLGHVRAELETRGMVPDRPLVPDQLVIRASSVGAVPSVRAAVKSLLAKRFGVELCPAANGPSFCIRLPERNNFQTAQREQEKVAAGGSYFILLLLILIAVGAAGLQVQTVLARWRYLGVLQAVGFSPGQVLGLYLVELAAVVGGGVVLAFLLLMSSRTTNSLSAFATSAVVAGLAAVAAALPVLLWPLSRPPAELIRVSE